MDTVRGNYRGVNSNYSMFCQCEQNKLRYIHRRFSSTMPTFHRETRFDVRGSHYETIKWSKTTAFQTINSFNGFSIEEVCGKYCCEWIKYPRNLNMLELVPRVRNSPGGQNIREMPDN